MRICPIAHACIITLPALTPIIRAQHTNAESNSCVPHPSRVPLHIDFMRHPRSSDATIPCLTKRPPATVLYTTGAWQACATRVTELGTSLAMLGRVHRELPFELLALLPGEQSLLEPHTQAMHRMQPFEDRPLCACQTIYCLVQVCRP